MISINEVRSIFQNKLKNHDFTIDKTNAKTIEIYGESILIKDETSIFGTLNEDYAKRELEWYKSQSLCVDDIPGKTPKIWEQVSSKTDHLINSNYGWCIWSEKNYNQFENVLNELKNNSDSRRALMIYTRPKMWYDYNFDGMSDFMCTTSVQILIRNNKLHYIINQRSCDAVFGFKNDIYWHKYVQNKLINSLKETYPNLEKGDLIQQVGSLHVYERHFYLIDSENYAK